MTDLVYVGEFGSQVHAVDRDNGNIVWSAPAENWVWGAPAYADGVVYYADIDGNVFAVDAVNGEREVAGAGCRRCSDHARWLSTGSSMSPLKENRAMYPAGALTAFDAGNGEQMWRQLTHAPLFTAPVAVDDAVVVALQSESVHFDCLRSAKRAHLCGILPHRQEE